MTRLTVTIQKSTHMPIVTLALRLNCEDKSDNIDNWDQSSKFDYNFIDDNITSCGNSNVVFFLIQVSEAGQINDIQKRDVGDKVRGRGPHNEAEKSVSNSY